MNDAFERSAQDDELQALIAAVSNFDATAVAAEFSKRPESNVPEPLLSPLYASAAVLATFDRTTLRPAPPTSVVAADSDEGGLEAVIRDSRVIVGKDRKERWALRNDVRRNVLSRLGSNQAILAVLEANPDHGEDPTQKMFKAYLCGTAQPLDKQDGPSLGGTAQVLDWLEGLDLLTGLPSREAVRRRSDLVHLLEPFDELAGSNFAGRRDELATLRTYVGVLPPGSVLERVRRAAEAIFDIRQKPPLVVWGVGGVGKSTLLSRFILDHATLPDTERFPWAYIDFDRPGLLAEEPLTLMIEAVRQLGVQYPDSREYCDRVSQRWLKILSERPPEVRLAMRRTIKRDDSIRTTQAVSRNGWESFPREFADLLNNLKVDTSPFLLVLDTFEVVQYRSELVTSELMEFLAAFQRQVPRLRSVIVGRAALGKDVGLPTQQLQLGNFDAEAAQAFLLAKGVPPDAADRINGLVGGSPLSLRLAAEAYRKIGDVPGALRGRGLLGFRLQDNNIQAQLFARIVNHIHDADVRKLAYPGLVLRRVTPDIIREVLAKPCDVELSGPGAERRLFEELSREVSLVDPQGDSLTYRPDVRRIVLPVVHELQPDRARAIAEAAIAYYESREMEPADDPTARIVDRSEELYHRLHLGQPPETLDSRWLPSVELYLADAIDELPIRERAWLATRLGRSLTPEERSQADQEGWERETARRVREQLSRDDAKAALTALRERSDRSANSPLWALEAEVLERLEDFAGLRSVVEAGLASVDSSGSRRDIAIALRVRGARANLRDGLFEEAGLQLDEAQDLAEDMSPLRTIEVLLHRLASERMRSPKTDASGADETVRRRLFDMFQALTDNEVLGNARLAAWLAAEMTLPLQAALARVIRLTGLSTDQRSALRTLALALTSWDASQASAGSLADSVGAEPGASLTERWSRFVLAASPASLGAGVAKLMDVSPIPLPVHEELVGLMLRRAGDLLVPGDPLRAARLQPEAGDVEDARAPAPSFHLAAGQLTELADVLADALPSRLQLGEMTLHRLNRNLDTIAPYAEPLHTSARRLVRLADSEGWTAELIAAARESNPTTPSLYRFAEQFGLTPQTGDFGSFSPRTPQLIDPDVFARRLAEIETRVCRVEIGGTPVGTACLVGADLVLTAATCVERVLSGTMPPSQLGFRFDLKILQGRTEISAGTVCGVSEKNWVVARTTGDDLGQVIVRLSRPVGAEPVGAATAEPGANARRWFDLSASAISRPSSGHLLMIHYGSNGTLHLVVSTETVNFPQDGRLRIPIDMESDTRGAPCFDYDLNLAAMAVNTGDNAAVANAVSMPAILERLARVGLDSMLGQALP